MQGAGDNYLSAFALFLHAAPFHVGLLSALPQLVGTWAQLASAGLLARISRRRPLVLAGAATQAFMWIPLLTLPLLWPSHGPWLLIACAVAYHAGGHFTVPAWNSLMGDLVHPDGRGLYFARRARLMAIASFSMLCLSGLVLHWSDTLASPWIGFALIFLAAAAARALSTYYLSRIHEPPATAPREAAFRPLEFLRRAGSGRFRNFLAFSGLMHVCVLMSGPYFVVYMLRDLRFSYLEYTLWLAAGATGQFVTYKTWGRLGDRYGNKKLLVVTGFLVPILPLLYLFKENLWYVTAVNFSGGVVWAGFGLALQNYVFDSVLPEDRAKGVALWSTVNAGGWFVGALLGSWFAATLPSRLTILGWEASFASSLPLVFALSGVGRFLVSTALLGSFHEPRQVESISHRDLVTELPLVKPVADVFGLRENRQ
jgi:MFS family permease